MGTASNSLPYGVIIRDGTPFVERPQIFGQEVTITTPNQELTNQRFTNPGVATFLLKGLSRDIQFPGQPDVIFFDTNFFFRITNTEGSTSFLSGGLGIFDDYVIDNCCFGTGQFPYPLIPPIPVMASGSLLFDVKDNNPFNSTVPPYPYTISFAFHGSLLFPLNQVTNLMTFSQTGSY